MEETDRNKQIHHLKHSSIEGVQRAEDKSNFDPNGRKNTRKISRRRCTLNPAPNSMQKIFRLAKMVREISARERLCAKVLRYKMRAQSTFGACEQFQFTGEPDR